tara:strand:+ start:209 stop:388 length:180 start_codon:yes stop_codon:yes gene_type:complete
MSTEDTFDNLKVQHIIINEDAYDNLVDVLDSEPKPTEALKVLINRPKRWAVEEKGNDDD